MNYNRFMIQKVLKVGTSAAVTIPKDSLEELGLSIGDDVRVLVDGTKKTMTITAKNSQEAREDAMVAQSARDFVARYREALTNLADR